MNDQEWLDGLKVGDEVVILGDRDYISKVERFTKTLIITTGGRKFRKNGTSPGSWYSGILAEPTKERVDKIRQTRLANFLRQQVKWEELSLEKLREIFHLLPKSS